jgi:DNA-binding PadR family transcriptional regulator
MSRSLSVRAATFLPLTHLSYYLLLVLAESPGHAYALVQRIRERSNGLVDPGTGSFYSIVGGCVDNGLIKEQNTPSDDARRKRQFALTPLGRAVLDLETERLRSLVGDATAALSRGRGGAR